MRRGVQVDPPAQRAWSHARGGSRTRISCFGAATYGGRGDAHVRFDFDHGWQCRVYVLRDAPGSRAARAPRSAEGAADVDGRRPTATTCRGRARDTARRRRVRTPRVRCRRRRQNAVRVTAGRLVARTLRSIRSASRGRSAWRSWITRSDRRDVRVRGWSERDAIAASLRVRDTRRTSTSASATRPARSTSTAGACARSRSTRSATTRETRDPLYKHWPFLIARSADSGIALRRATTTRSRRRRSTSAASSTTTTASIGAPRSTTAISTTT